MKGSVCINLTVITIAAIAIVIAFFTIVLWPNIQSSLNTQWGNASKCYDENGQPKDCDK